MPVTIVKTQESPKAQETAAEVVKSLDSMELVQLADLYGQLAQRVEELKKHPVLVQFDKVKKEILSRVGEEFENFEPVELTGEQYQVTVSAGSIKRSVTDKEKLRELLGPDTFLALADVKLSDIDKYLNPEQVSQVVTSEVSSSRSIKATALV